MHFWMKGKDKSENFTEKNFKSPLKMDVKLDVKNVKSELSETKSKDGTLTEVMMTHKVSLGTDSKARERTDKHQESDDEKFDDKNIKILGNKYVQFLTPLEYTPKAGGKSFVLPDGESTKNSTKAQQKVSSLMTGVSTDVNHQGTYVHVQCLYARIRREGDASFQKPFIIFHFLQRIFQRAMSWPKLMNCLSRPSLSIRSMKKMKGG